MEKLTTCEELVMKTIWDASEELSLTEIMQRVNEKYHKEWKPQTVSTFLARLVRKGYLQYYRKGRVFFYQTIEGSRRRSLWSSGIMAMQMSSCGH